MKNVSMIAVIGKNNELGVNNHLIWHLPNDLKFLKKMTMDKDIVMGDNTFCSLPKLLPGRKHIVLTNKDLDNNEIIIIRSRSDLIEYLKQKKEEVMIIGGSSIYNQMLDLSDKLYLIEVNSSYEDADCYFPRINYNEWDKEILVSNEDNGISYNHVLYKRKNKF